MRDLDARCCRLTAAALPGFAPIAGARPPGAAPRTLGRTFAIFRFRAPATGRRDQICDLTLTVHPSHVCMPVRCLIALSACVPMDLPRVLVGDIRLRAVASLRTGRPTESCRRLAGGAGAGAA